MTQQITGSTWDSRKQVARHCDSTRPRELKTSSKSRRKVVFCPLFHCISARLFVTKASSSGFRKPRIRLSTLWTRWKITKYKKLFWPATREHRIRIPGNVYQVTYTRYIILHIIRLPIGRTYYYAVKKCLCNIRNRTVLPHSATSSPYTEYQVSYTKCS